MEEKNLQSFLRQAALIILLQLAVYYGFLGGRMTNPDTIWNGTLYKTYYRWEITLGRFLLPLDGKLTNYIVNPAAMTILAIVFSSAAIVLLTDSFRFTGIRIRERFVCEALLALAPVLWCTYTYYYCSAFYMKGYLLASVAYILAAEPTLFYTGISYSHSFEMGEHKPDDAGAVGTVTAGNRRSPGLFLQFTGLFAATVCLACSLATYQAYIAVYLSFACLWMILRCLYAEDDEGSLKRLLLCALRFLTVFVLGVVLYLAANKAVLNCMELHAEASRGFDQMGKLHWTELLPQIKSAYVDLVHYFFGDRMIHNSTGAFLSRRMLNLIYFGLSGVVSFITLVKIRCSRMNKLFAVFLILLLPVLQMVILIAGPGADVMGPTGSIMLPCMNVTYILPLLVVFPWISGKKSREEFFRNVKGKGKKPAHQATAAGQILLYLASAGVVWMLVLLALDAQQYMTIRRNQADTIMRQMADRIELVSGGDTEHQEVCIAGSWKQGNYPEEDSVLRDSVHWTIARYGIFWVGYESQTPGMQQYFADQMQLEFTMADNEEYQRIITSDFFRDMPVFPAEDSVQKNGNVIVVKLSEVE